jgi:hypothetical protein
MNCSAPFGSIAIVASASATAFVLEHGYCRSVYVTDPNGMIVELTHDAPNVEQINADRLADAHAELKRWLGGDHDDYRAEIQKSSACVGTTTERFPWCHRRDAASSLVLVHGRARFARRRLADTAWADVLAN